jgi:hypothetical protein
MSNEQENCGRSSRQQKIWVRDIRGPLSLNALDKYMGAVRRHPSPEISMTSTLGSFQSLNPSKSAYNAFFIGSIRFAPRKRIFEVMGSNTVQIFHKACRTYSCETDRLAKKGLPCPRLAHSVNNLLN